MRQQAAIAYCFCRKVDDLADDSPNGPDRLKSLQVIKEALIKEDSSNPDAAGMIELIKLYPEIKEPAISLIEACAADQEGVRIQNETELGRYSHGVAGNVGLIMYPILGGRDLLGRTYAADLGIAMQITNIARDVYEDLGRNRIYIPQDWLGNGDKKGLLGQNLELDSFEVKAAVERLVKIAEAKYSSALLGLKFLDPCSRFSIRIAANCYQAIGDRVIKNDRLVKYRAVVPLHTKLLLALKAMQWLTHDLYASPPEQPV